VVVDGEDIEVEVCHLAQALVIASPIVFTRFRTGMTTEGLYRKLPDDAAKARIAARVASIAQVSRRDLLHLNFVIAPARIDIVEDSFTARLDLRRLASSGSGMRTTG
jgi:hypothetical protein